MSKEIFELKEEHIKLLQRMYWEYSDCETGAPAVDGKRPYGNSYVPPDVAEILEVELDENDDEKYDKQVDEVMKFHYETHTALEIILSTKSFETGKYRKLNKQYGRNSRWEKVK